MDIPKRFGRFEVIGLIAPVTFGAIYKVRDLGRNRGLFALKVWTPSEMTPEVRQRWLREATRRGLIQHANLVTVYDLSEGGGSAYKLMELLEGETLDRLMKRGTPLCFCRQIEIIATVAETLQFVHDHGLVHGNVKPANIMMLRDRKLKLLGLEPAWSDIDLENIEVPGIRGTPAYMSPEQINGERLDGRADIFGLGCTLHELVDGRLPFEGSSTIDMFTKILREAPRESTKAKEFDLPELQRIMDKAMAKRKSDRYQSCTEMSEDLERLQMQLEP